jgi:hypothetical protein
MDPRRPDRLPNRNERIDRPPAFWRPALRNYDGYK